MSDTSGESALPKKKSFSSRLSRKMDKLSSTFKRGDSSDSDSDDASSSSGKGKSLFGGKLHNPFKKGHSSDSDDDDDDSGNGGDRPSKSKPGDSGQSTPMPTSQPTASQQLSGAAAAAAAAASTSLNDSHPPAVVKPAATAAPPLPERPATATRAKTMERAPAGTGDAVSAPSTRATHDGATVHAVPAVAAAAAVGATGTPVPEPEPEPKKPRATVGGPVFGAPEILLTGVKGDPDAVMKTLRARGFVVHLAMLYEESVPQTMNMVLAMGPKLLVKSAVERNLTAKARADYTSGEVGQLCASAIHVIKRSGVEYEEVNLLHDKEALEDVAKADSKNVADSVHSYFGPYIGIYFEWLRFYTKALLVPTIGGVFLFVDQIRTGSPDSPFLPIFCILIMVWVSLFLDLWRRRNNEVAFRWGVDGVEDDEVMRVEAAKDREFKPNPAGKLCVTVPIILAAIYAVIRAMLYCIWLSDHAIEVYGEDSYMQYYPLVLYSVVPLIASNLYTFLAKALNDFEEHPTPVRIKNAMVIKMFVFQFVNSYCSLLYVGFWLRDLRRLRQLLMTMMMIKQFIGQLVEKYLPDVMMWNKNRKLKKNPPVEPSYLVKHTGTIEPQELFEEMKQEMANVEDDYLEMVLQFGYVSMFAVVFPLAPLFAYINNVWEFKLDLSQLVKTRRPQAHAESSIGAWQLCLEMVGVVACLTNLLLAVLVSKNVDLYVPTSMAEHLGSFEAKVVLVVVGEHILFLLKAISSGLIDKVPRVVREAQLVMAIRQREEQKEFRRLASGLPASEGMDKGFVMMEDGTPQDRLRNLHKTHDVWKFGPKWYLPLVFMPFIITWFKWSSLIVLPIAFVFVSYLQHEKDLADKALSLGVVKDPKILELVTGFLPSWYSDSEVERVDWMNKILDKMWVSASSATESLFDTTIQPILDSYRPPGVNALGFKKVSLGTIPPKIVGVRALEMKNDKAVIDIDLRWAGNAEFVLEAGVKPVPLIVTLNKICFSGRMRVELAPLVPVFPCFGAIVLTFMEKPYIDFKFKIGKLNVMSIGPGDMNVGSLISDTIKNIVTNLMVFPVKMVIPILDEQDILGLTNPTPTGVVELTVVGCNDLRSADIGGKSDPYVTVKLGMAQEMKTDHINRTLNPRYDETFDLLVYERSVEVIEFEVYDHDNGPSDDDFLGRCELPLSVLMADLESSHNIPLSGTNTGSLLLKATFFPLLSGKKRTDPVDEDVIVNVASDDITDETVAADTYHNLSPDGQPIKIASETKSHKGPAVDPSTLKPHVVTPSDTTMGVITVMGIECKGVKPGDRYVSVICGNHKRKTAVVEDMANFACPEVFNFLIRGAKSAVVEFLLKEEESIGKDKCLGSFKVNVAEVMANDDQLDGEWDLAGEKAKGSIKLRLKWSGRVGDGAD